MIKNNPTKGLLIYSFYASRGNLGIALLMTFAMGVALLITGNHTVYAIFLLKFDSAYQISAGRDAHTEA